jgi:uncharacterized Zn-binding protein involved in type VI secretion
MPKGKPAARMNDPVTGSDTHILLVPSPSGATPTPTPLPFAGQLTTALSPNVNVNKRAAATKDSIAQNMPPHIPPPGTSFSKPPTNQGRVIIGSLTVKVNGKPMARMGDQVMTCNDPVDAPTCTITAGSNNVFVS